MTLIKNRDDVDAAEADLGSKATLKADFDPPGELGGRPRGARQDRVDVVVGGSETQKVEAPPLVKQHPGDRQSRTAADSEGTVVLESNHHV